MINSFTITTLTSLSPLYSLQVNNECQKLHEDAKRSCDDSFEPRRLFGPPRQHCILAGVNKLRHNYARYWSRR